MKSSTLVAIKAGSDVFGKLAVLGVLALAARALTTEAFAWMAIASTMGWLLAVASDAGLQLHLAREVAHDPERAGRALWPLLAIRVRTLSAAVLLTVAISFVWLPSHYFAPFACVAVSYLLTSIVEFLNFAYRGLNRSDLESTLNLSQRLVSLGMAWLLLRWWPSFTSVAIAMLVPPLLASLVSLSMMVSFAPFDAEAPPASTDTLLREVAPIGAGIFISALYFRVDLFMLQHWATAEAVAQYGAVFRLIDAMRLFPGALLAVVLPRMFRGRDSDFLRTLSLVMLAFGTVSMVVGYALAPFGVPLAFGAAFAPAAPLFRILTFAFPLLCLNYGLTTQLIGWNGQRAFAWITAVAFVANVAMNLIVIPRFGAIGAAWSTVATEAILTVGAVFALRFAPGRVPQ